MTEFNLDKNLDAGAERDKVKNRDFHFKFAPPLMLRLFAEACSGQEG
jgi:hypothetical protein